MKTSPPEQSQPTFVFLRCCFQIATVSLGLGMFVEAPAVHAFTLARDHQAQAVVVQSADATAPERHALAELVFHLHQVTGAQFEVQTNGLDMPHRAIIVGPGALATKLFPEPDFAGLGDEEFILRTKGNYLLLAGGRPRGTIYAVNRFLQDQCGVRWWTPWATNLPARATLRIPELNVRGKPAFEYRAPFWYQGFDPLWKARNGANDENRLIPTEWGGSIRYKGFAHTFYPLVPPEVHFKDHPEWYSLIQGKRTHERAQLCLANPELREFVVGRVKAWLREAPDAAIVSVTQNDWHGQCQCPDCLALDTAEGSPAGSMIAFVNYIAEKIEPEFPRVAVDTFAYQYTRKPPKTIRPRPNVIVRLCSIECNFREPLDHPSNAEFLADLKGWARICQRLYLWDYTTDFANYVLPHPNWFTLGANVRLFQQHNVRGVFEQGAYQGYGSEMGELRAWVLAQLLWGPQQNDRALIREFLEGYYGPAAAKPIERYLELLHETSQGFYLGCYTRSPAPHRTAKVLIEAERLWRAAGQAVASDPELTARVRLSHLPVRFAFLRDWERLRYDAWEENCDWPFAESRPAVAAEFAAACQGMPGKPWTVVQRLNEPGLTVEKFLAGLGTAPARELGPPPPPRLTHPAPPADLAATELREAVDLQDNTAHLAKPGEWVEIRPDPAASDRRAAWLPGSHKEWAFRISANRIPSSPTGSWKTYVIARVEAAADAPPDTAAFTAGVYDNAAKNSPAQARFSVSDTGAGYRSHLIGDFAPNEHRDIYVAPAGQPGVRALWVDRIYLVPAR